MKQIFGTFLILMALASFSGEQALAACDKPSLNGAIYASQQLKPETEDLMLAIAGCNSIALRQQAVYWGAVYNGIKNREQRTVSLIEKAFPPNPALKGVDRLYHEARRGKWEALQDKIDSGDPEFLDNLNARIVLAHSLMLSRQFDEALQVFEQYLKIKPDDDLVDAEYLYALIWAGRYSTAKARVAHLQKFSLNAYLKRTAEHADGILKDLDFKRDPRALKAALRGSIYSSIQSESTYLGDRQSLGVAYQDRFGGYIRAHQIDSKLSDEDYNIVEVMLNGSHKVFGLDLDTDLGYLAGDNGTILGRLQLSYDYDSWRVLGGLSQDPLSLKYIQAKIHSTVHQRSLYAELMYKTWFRYKGSMNSDDGLSLYESHHLEVNAPIFYGSTGKGLYVTLPIHYQSHPKPSPFYQTSPKDLKVQAGIRYNYDFTRASAVESLFLLGSRYRNSRANEGSYDTTVALNAKLKFQTRLSRRFQSFFLVELDNNSREEYEKEAKNRTSLEIGLSFTDEEL